MIEKWKLLIYFHDTTGKKGIWALMSAAPILIEDYVEKALVSSIYVPYDLYV